MRLNAEDARAVREAIQRDTAFTLPELKEENGLSMIEFPYLPVSDDILLPEEEDED